MGGRVLMAGKPYAPIYDLALREAGGAERSRVLCIGDGVITDVKGAADQGLDCLFIAKGIHGEAAMRNGRLDAALVEGLLAEEDVSAKYAMADLLW
jgi:ribonucleotide monophosphatase NagD (HAD superfamily)